MKKAENAKSGQSQGFTLIDALLGLVIVAVGFWGGMEFFYRTQQVSVRADVHLRASLVAQSLSAYLEREGIPAGSANPGPVPGNAGIGECADYQWSLADLFPVNGGVSGMLTIYHRSIQPVNYPVFLKESMP